MPPLYPAGPAGAGLLLLRFAVAGSLLTLSLPFRPGSDPLQMVTVAIASGLCIGIGARLLALLSLIAIADAIDGHAASALFALLHVVISLALAFTGAGAYSADARLFGRRRVRLPARDDTSE